ncbi:MAG: hypothetical protein IJ099_01910 [Alphaproteobacteria bacterium]|nr:hypothetical protein [Alphaproteobacteria bacterium]
MQKMKQMFLILCFAIFLWPSTVCAKTAVISKVELFLKHSIATVQTVVEEAQRLAQDAMTIMTNPSQAKDIVQKRKEERKKKKAEKEKNKVANKAPAGTGEKMSGTSPSAELSDANEKNYVNTEEKNDVAVQAAFEKRINKEMVHNVSAMYARGLVKRYQLQQEGAELKKEQEEVKNKKDETIPEVVVDVLEVRMRTDSRWIGVLQAMANDQERAATVNLSSIKLTQKPDKDAEENSEGEKK